MGQLIEVEAVRLGDVVIFDTDRSLTGQDGESFLSGAAESSDTLSGQLAAQLFDQDSELAHVYVFSNVISVQRRAPWTEEAVEAATETVRRFFLFYQQADLPAGEESEG